MDIEIEDPTEEEARDKRPGPGDEIEDGEEAQSESGEEGVTAEEEAGAGTPAEESETDLEPAAEEEIEKWKNLALRNQADLENYRKRMAREKSEAVQFANVSLLRSLLPIMDNFEMGLQAAKSESEDSVIYQGMAMVRKQFDEFLSDEGVETIESIGADFDPNQHEAIKQEWSDEEPEGAIIGELRRGYRMGERLLRPANVVVSKGSQPDSENETDESSGLGLRQPRED